MEEILKHPSFMVKANFIDPVEDEKYINHEKDSKEIKSIITKEDGDTVYCINLNNGNIE